MGYYTSYELSVFDLNGQKLSTEKVVEVLLNSGTLDKPGFDSIRELVLEDDFFFNRKWYEHHEQMLAFSLLHTDLVFVLNGQGEEANDIWLHEYHNGKVEESYIQELKPTGRFFNKGPMVKLDKSCGETKLSHCNSEIEFTPSGFAP